MHVVTLPQLQHPRPIEQNVHASRRCWWSRTIASSYGSQQQPQQHKQQPDYWYEQHGPQQLQQTLQLPSWRFQRLVQQEPSLLAFQGDTLQVTLQALCDALHANHKTVVSIVEQRPALLLQPQEPVQVLQQLSQVLGRSTQQTAFLLAPHPQLLALQPQQLQQHMQDLCGVMHWPCSNQQQMAAAAAAAGPAVFVQLLGLPVQLTASKLQDLSTALDGPLQLTAQLVQHHPALLNLSPAVLRSRLFAIAQAQGCNCRQLLSGLDQQQLQGLSGLLLLSPGRLTAQLQGLEALLRSLRQQSSPTAPDSASPFETQALGGRSEGGDSSTSTSSSQQQQHARVTACRLLLRLGTRSSLAGVQVTLTTLQGIVRTVEQWQLQLAAADDCQLAHLLSAGHQGLAQAKFLAAAGCVAELTLVDVVLLPPAAFNKRFPGYQPWLSGNVSS